MTEPALEAVFDGNKPALATRGVERRIEVAALGTAVVERDVRRALRIWQVTPGAAGRDVGMIRVEHELLAKGDEKVKVELAEATLATVYGAAEDEGGVRGPLRARVTVTVEVTWINGHRVAP
jgi:hypothetical protein